MQGVQSGVTNSELRVRVHSEGAARLLTFPSTHTVWLGRDQTCDVVLRSQEVSRRHLSLFVKDGELLLRDHSTYGTRVNGQPLQHAVRSVAPPARIELGPYRVEVTLSEGVLGVRLVADSAVSRSALAGHGRWVALAMVFCFALWLGVRSWQEAEPVASSSAARTACPPALPSSGASAPSVLRAVQLLRAGDRVSALRAYRSLAARDDSRAELSIVAELLARELSCQP